MPGGDAHKHTDDASYMNDAREALKEAKKQANKAMKRLCDTDAIQTRLKVRTWLAVLKNICYF